MNGALRSAGRAASSYVQAVFAVLGFASLAVWLIDVVSSKHHHPLTYWLVVSLALLLVASLIWGVRRGAPASDGVHIHMESGDIVYQPAPGLIPSETPQDQTPGGADTTDETPRA
jgi:hypothetical protein